MNLEKVEVGDIVCVKHSVVWMLNMDYGEEIKDWGFWNVCMEKINRINRLSNEEVLIGKQNTFKYNPKGGKLDRTYNEMKRNMNVCSWGNGEGRNRRREEDIKYI